MDQIFNMLKDYDAPNEYPHEINCFIEVYMCDNPDSNEDLMYSIKKYSDYIRVTLNLNKKVCLTINLPVPRSEQCNCTLGTQYEQKFENFVTLTKNSKQLKTSFDYLCTKEWQDMCQTAEQLHGYMQKGPIFPTQSILFPVIGIVNTPQPLGLSR